MAAGRCSSLPAEKLRGYHVLSNDCIQYPNLHCPPHVHDSARRFIKEVAEVLTCLFGLVIDHTTLVVNPVGDGPQWLVDVCHLEGPGLGETLGGDKVAVDFAFIVDLFSGRRHIPQSAS